MKLSNYETLGLRAYDNRGGKCSEGNHDIKNIPTIRFETPETETIPSYNNVTCIYQCNGEEEIAYTRKSETLVDQLICKYVLRKLSATG